MSDGSEVKVVLTNNNLRSGDRQTAVVIVESVKAILELYRHYGEYKLTMAQHIRQRNQDQFRVIRIDRTFNRITLRMKPGANNSAWDIYLIYPPQINVGELYANLQEFEKDNARRLPRIRTIAKIVRAPDGGVKAKPLTGGLNGPTGPLFTPPAQQAAPKTFEPVSKPTMLEVPQQTVYGPIKPPQPVTQALKLRPALAGDEYETVMLTAAELGIPEPVPVGLGLYCRAMEVTPELAFEWLNNYNTHNRSASKTSVEKYAGDALSDKWLLHHQGIGFNKEPMLMDGQQRLMAIVESYKPMPLMITMNLEPEAQIGVDQQRNRNTRDVAKLIGIELGNSAGPPMLRRAFLGLDAKNQALSPQGVLQAVETYGEGYRWTLHQFGTHPRIRGLAVAGTMAVVFRAYYHVDIRRLEEFVAVLMTGMPKRGDADIAAITLQKFLLTSKIAKNRGDLIYGKTMRSLLAFLQGERLVRISSSEQDMWPLPLDPATHFATLKPDELLGSSFYRPLAS